MSLRLSLTQRYALLINGTILVVIVLLGALFLHKLKGTSAELREQSGGELASRIESQLVENGQRLADGLAERAVNPLYALDMASLREMLVEAKASKGIEYAVVTDKEGRILHDGSLTIESYGQQAGWLNVVATETELARVSAPVTLAGEQLGAVHIGVSLTPALVQGERMEAQLGDLMAARARDMLTSMALYALVLLLGGLLLAAVISRRFATPIRQLADYAREVGRGRRDAPPAMERGDEIGMLAASLDAMSRDLRLSAGEVDYLAYHDSLTRLPNRAHFKRLLREEVERLRVGGRGFGVLFIDLDQFKQVNDTLGHEAGDEFLTIVANRLSERLQSTSLDAAGELTLARLGGDEFTVLARGVTDPARGEQLAAAVIETLAEPIEVQTQAFSIGASIGITFCPRDGDDLNVLLRNADRAMYRAKEAGRNTFCVYDRSMDGTATRQLSLEADLRDVLNANDLTLAYQPIVRVTDGAVVAVEALCRWHHPVLGYVQPSRFVQIAEQSGQIEHLDQFVVSQLLHDLSQLHDEGFPHLAGSANIASLHLRKPAILEHIAERLDYYRLNGEHLRIEVREKNVMRHLEHASVGARRLRELGVPIWIDDFGTRIATLKHIDVLPVSGIKIHSEFIDGISAGQNQRVVAQAITEMCHNIGLPVTAEGVEHQEQLEYLQEIGADFAQGYLFARPMPYDDLLGYLRRQRKGDDGRLILLSDYVR